MTQCDLDSSVTDWIIDHPNVLSVLKELQIDFNCAGKSLAFACRERKLDPQQVLERLLRLVDEEPDAGASR